MKKSNYINKYDFINYLTRPDYLLFLSNSEIEALYSTALEKLTKKKQKEKINLDDEDEDDSFETNEEIDSYEYFLEEKENNENVDKTNTKIQEGIIIDQKSKEYIKQIYKNIDDYDFDDPSKKIYNLEDCAKKTKELILNNNKLIIFQPVFILENKITKCDAIIKDDKKIIIIETKGTTSSKPHHYLDLLFQYNVIENQTFLKNYIFEYYLCLVDYVRLNKNEISFTLTPYFNYSKSSNYSKDSYLVKKNKKIGIFKNMENDEDYSLSFIDAFNNDFQKILNKRANNEKNIMATNSIDKAIEEISCVNKNFENIVNQIHNKLIENQKINEKDLINLNIENIKPSLKDKSYFKKNDFFVSFKNIYYLKGYDLFKFSGNASKQQYEDLKLILTEGYDYNFPENYLKQSKNINYYSLFNSDKPFSININATKQFIEKISPIKVYFDFETINTAIRAVNDSFPFTQVVTQCSIIITKYDKEVYVENLICDPKKINKEWYEKIVNCLSKYKNEIDNTSFIVYNKSFEKNRLEEMKLYLNDEYQKTITEINNRLVDLADLFHIKKDTYIFAKDLYGYYSIKKVLPLIKKINNQIFIDTKCKDYNNLDVKNGKICQEETSLRFFDLIDEKQWKDLEPKLQEYCENDVRAMIAVEKFAIYLINNKNII